MKKELKKGDYSLDIDSDVFRALKADFNTILRRTLSNMESKGSEKAEISIKLDVSAILDSIPDAKSGEGAYRDIIRPEFRHTVSSVMKIQDKETGKFSGEYELVWDKETCQYIVRAIDNGQMSIDDVIKNEMEAAPPIRQEVHRLDAGSVAYLEDSCGPKGITDESEDGIVEADYIEVDETDCTKVPDKIDSEGPADDIPDIEYDEPEPEEQGL